MAGKKPKWLESRGEDKPTRFASERQEKRIAKEFGGRKTPNSGASFGQNDVKTPKFDIEAKTTKSEQYILKMADIHTMERKADKNKIPLFIIEFDKHGREFVLLDKADFLAISGAKDLE